MLAKHYDRSGLNADHPKVVRLILCGNYVHGGYLTFAGDCGCSAQHDIERYAIVGTTYGSLRTPSGDLRTFRSESGARYALKQYLNEGE